MILGGLLGVAALAVAGCSTLASPHPVPGSPATHAPTVTFARQASPPPLAATPTGPGYVGMIDPVWARETADATGIPLRAVLAYAGAAVRAAEVYPDCGIGWNTLAGIGLVESDHGSFHGSSIGADFRVSPPIYGPILDGGDTANIPDTDGGAIDGNAKYDRAVGPMQLIPATWASWPSDGNGDGVPDPQNIADESIAAANSLCRASGGMTTPDGWRSGIASYNVGSAYLKAVATAAKRYVEAAPAR